MKELKQYSFLKALRPFSLVVALVSCGLGIYLSWIEGYTYLARAWLIIVAGVAAQAGINLINDLEDLNMIDTSSALGVSAVNQIKQNAVSACAFFVCAFGIGGYLILLHGWPMFWLIAFSTGAALSYNLGPFNFKHRGLSMIQVFLLMGVLMVQGAYYAMSGAFSNDVLLHSIPISLLVSLLLLSNELRDWEYDSQQHVRTLTVRVGYQAAVRLYWSLLISCYAIAIILLQTTLASPSSSHPMSTLWLAIPLIMLKPISNSIKSSTRPELTPLTGRLFLLFGASYILALS